MIVFGDYALKTDVQNFDETAVIGSLLHRPIAHLLRRRGTLAPHLAGRSNQASHQPTGSNLK